MDSLRSVLPAPRALLGCLPLRSGVLASAALAIAWHLFALATGLHSLWAAYHLWMAVSCAALLYGHTKRDAGHVRWFASAVFADALVYAASVPFDSEFAMTDVDRCEVAMAANRGLRMEQCLEHVHEIKAIAVAIRAATLLAKLHWAAAARGFELHCAPAADPNAPS
ncbi:hypothetical protein GGI07_003566 [Coemansia sp. Benny D115]|nr:hypothetical protein GGI07_003566 [Coemansia sp. Benny D115]